MTTLRVIDSHTAGEPTRLILEGGPDLGSGTLAERAGRFDADHRHFFTAVLNEPRGHEAMVGALMVSPSEADCAAGVIYFNTVGTLGMCGHATIGVAVSLAYLGKIAPGTHRIETPVGVVSAVLMDAHSVSVENVESYRTHKKVRIETDRWGEITGDVAWGGNWFFLVPNSPVAVVQENLRELSDLAHGIRDALDRGGIAGTAGARIDHIELFGPAQAPDAQSKCFVLCPGGAFDRSPCGTGCSAKIACLAEDGAWPPGREWTQESIIGSTYRVSYRPGLAGGVIPRVTGQAFVTGESTLIFDEDDPYRQGIRL